MTRRVFRAWVRAFDLELVWSFLVSHNEVRLVVVGCVGQFIISWWVLNDTVLILVFLFLVRLLMVL